MIILEKPYVSELLIKTLVESKIAVLKNETSKSIAQDNDINILSSEDFINAYKDDTPLYTNSESSIEWISENIKNNDLIRKIGILKDKVKFRKFIKEIYPDFFFKELNYDKLFLEDFTSLKLPFILKPAVGFFSIGVYKISDLNDWTSALLDIKNNTTSSNEIYSKSVVDNSRFILEEYINGVEFAIDAYYDDNGNPIILNILKHDFSSDSDVNDRLYTTSKDIIEKYIYLFSDLLKLLNSKFNIQNFPFHLEVRVDKEKIVPIEINPARFAGWCTTDIGYYGYGINNYDYFFNKLSPDWTTIFKGKEDRIYSIIILNKPSDLDSKNIEKFDYEKLLTRYTNSLDLRKVDFNTYPIFGFMFLETDKYNIDELDQLLKSDLREYIVTK